VSVQGQSIDIYETRVNRMLHGPEYRTHVSVGLFEGRHQTVTSETEMDDPSSRECFMRWIAGQIAIEGENVSWVANAEVQITKSSLLFPSKVWWAFFRAQLLATANDNTLSPSFASLVACLIVVYPLNGVRIIATIMRDKTLNEREGLSFPCLIGKLYLQANMPPHKLVDKWIEASKVTVTSNIKYFSNHLGQTSRTSGSSSTCSNLRYRELREVVSMVNLHSQL